MKFGLKKWLNFSLFNLLLVAFLGVFMRYKIGYEFPYFDQKNILHAHSHFAFLGWINHTLFVLILYVLEMAGIPLHVKRYIRFISVNLCCAYAMLVSFFISGYSVPSIVLSSLSIVVNYAFVYYLLKDINELNKLHPAKNWFRAALLFSVLSSVGTFALAFMIATKQFNQNWYLASVYYYLHFQYNGFFTFACFGLLLSNINTWLPSFKNKPSVFWLFFISCIPTYFLSTLWANLPITLYILVVIAAFMQLSGWILFLIQLKHSSYSATKGNTFIHYLFLILILSFTIKLLLQLGSTIPSLSKLAFGFRPIVIAYLHLVLLAIVSVFLLTYMHFLKLIYINTYSKTGLIVFVVAVFLNEIVLGIQGITAFSYTMVPNINEVLFFISAFIFLGILLLLYSQRKLVNF